MGKGSLLARLDACLDHARLGETVLFVAADVAGMAHAWGMLRTLNGIHRLDGEPNDDERRLSLRGGGSVKVASAKGPFLGQSLRSVSEDEFPDMSPLTKG